MKKIYFLVLTSIVMIILSTNLYAIPIVGSSSGLFTNPSGPGGMLVSGVGTSDFAWGNGAPFGSPSSSLNFLGNSFSTETDLTFSFGTLSYFNGTIAAGTQANTVDLNAQLTFTMPSGINQNFIYNLGLVNTPNTSDPNASADIVQFQTIFPSNSFTTGGVNYTLEFLGVGNITPDGSGFSTINQFNVFEGSTASADLLGRVTANFPNNPNPVPAPVPEPNTMILLGTGLIGLVRYNYKRKRQTA